jgi:hypothetical protein
MVGTTSGTPSPSSARLGIVALAAVSVVLPSGGFAMIRGLTV